mgnify:CR=1 FL=1
MALPDGIDPQRFAHILRLAVEEDLAQVGDLTTLLLPPELSSAAGRWEVVARQSGCVAGMAILSEILAALCPHVRAACLLNDGASCPPDTSIVRLEGPVGEMLTAERTLLNFLQRLCGIATLTARFVTAVAGTPAVITDTRKTTPGLRDLERYAVRCGGGVNHRAGLYSAVLIKDNHLAHLPPERLAFGVFDMLNRIEQLPRRPDFIEVEVDSLEQLRAVLRVVGVGLVLVDNFAPDALREAVALRDAEGLRGRVRLEASGGITLENVRRIAETGVDRISIGALTHSATALDLGLDARP